ncbi:hypothetical protein [Ferrimicrobium sp.]|nr:hypothetical protein [Ferrimicrobium sp.]
MHVLVESATGTREVTLNPDEFVMWFNEFRSRYAEMLDYLQSH